MLRKLVAGAAALVAGVTAACEQAPRSTVVYMRPGGVWSYLTYAQARGPVLVETVTPPVAGGGSGDLERRVAEAVRRGIHGLAVRTTPRADEAGAPDFRLRVAFDLPPSTAPEALCHEAAPAQEEDPSHLRVLAVFCHGTTLDAAVIGSIKRPLTPGDERIDKLISQISRQIFTKDRTT